eukprot:NODE_12580_length_445_cov_1.688679_g12557_i0.p2 GENE.NODE_12580_length_445_cov_1.688679_g12557_i0~~NODE_12580_length_445_cov_1.688679_g12557_i0.p2  ORF type:complete len:134 (-),score=4.26 NODE_12580_length_445_cov_1.688679_g12557_i0:43-417(-)
MVLDTMIGTGEFTVKRTNHVGIKNRVPDNRKGPGRSQSGKSEFHQFFKMGAHLRTAQDMQRFRTTVIAPVQHDRHQSENVIGMHMGKIDGINRIRIGKLAHQMPGDRCATINQQTEIGGGNHDR